MSLARKRARPANSRRKDRMISPRKRSMAGAPRIRSSVAAPTRAGRDCAAAARGGTFCSGTAAAIASRRRRPSGRPSWSTAMPRAAQAFSTPLRKVSRPESQSPSAAVSKVSLRKAADSSRSMASCEGNVSSRHQRPASTTVRPSSAGRRSASLCPASPAACDSTAFVMGHILIGAGHRHKPGTGTRKIVRPATVQAKRMG
jgi:hypothetical protein